MTLIFSAFLLLFSSSAFAGYVATISSISSPGYIANTNLNAVGKTSGCYLTPSMAISSLAGSSNYFIVTSLTTTGTWSARGTGTNPADAIGTYTSAACTVNPAVTSFPSMASGISDPAISGQSVLSGSSSTSTSTPLTDFTASDYALMGVDAPTIATVWSWGFMSVLGCYLLGYAVGVAKQVIRKV